VRITIEINKTLEGNITFCFVLYEKRFWIVNESNVNDVVFFLSWEKDQVEGIWRSPSTTPCWTQRGTTTQTRSCSFL
jgi:hypothetical protein